MTEWRPPGRTERAQAVYAAAELDRAARPERYALDAEALVEKALAAESADVLGPDDWREGLEVFVRSALEDARLNAVGLRMAAATAVGRIRARRSILRHVEAHPETTRLRPHAPIFIAGGWRTGTTFLQRLLAVAPSLHALMPWELGAPWKAAEADASARERLTAGAQMAHDHLHLLNPTLQRVHDSAARLPEECVLAMGTSFRNWGFLSTMRLEGYARWLEHQDLRPEYETYARILAMLDRRDGRRFLLKAPAHTAELEPLLATFPDAVVVHLHRDVVETVASGASLFAVFRSTYSDAVDPIDVGRFQAHQTSLWLDRALAFRERCAAEGRGCFVDVAYADLVRDPIAVARAIFEAAALAWSEETEARLEEHVRENRQHAHGRHGYTPSEFGLDPDALRERLSAYRLRFDVT